ncbi:3-carboxy-cis,cis-muconate cycloisomerase [Mycolicibacterium fortuitum]|uniref:3-carboxy-cis,cis-muconate cycloisomerase n=1 Tax=Mycolicibacterium fortuitum TaxID=1766 RepID=A0ABD6QI86_MYCFO|nr:lyase family protein [Mycolicibacterium fortuitum]OMC39550.1 3-carboxy-cis,cis-muconate cycloisomerase [Mycolicibacterium fortuitum]
MTNLLWPGDDRADDLMTDAALLEAMIAVEQAWLHVIVAAGIAPPEAACQLTGVLTAEDIAAVGAAAEDTGNPIVALTTELRRRLPAVPAQWLHRGLTSQDTLDTALAVSVRDVADRLRQQLAGHVSKLTDVVADHRSTAMTARTLTQHAVPTTFGMKAATWLRAILDAADALPALNLPAQIGGAAGTMAAATELARLRGVPGDPATVATDLAAGTADTLGLTAVPAWHTNRSPITRAGDALVACTDAWGRIAADVLTLSRPEIGELSEDPDGGRGGSSTMPHKHNPVLSVLIRRAAITAPPLAGTLHTAAALNNDERADGAWHAEWETLRVLARRTVIAGSHCTDLLDGLRINVDRMRANIGTGINAEQQAIADLAEAVPSPHYYGTAEPVIDAALKRAHSFIAGRQ